MQSSGRFDKIWNKKVLIRNSGAVPRITGLSDLWLNLILHFLIIVNKGSSFHNGLQNYYRIILSCRT